MEQTDDLVIMKKNGGYLEYVFYIFTTFTAVNLKNNQIKVMAGQVLSKNYDLRGIILSCNYFRTSKNYNYKLISKVSCLLFGI